MKTTVVMITTTTIIIITLFIITIIIITTTVLYLSMVSVRVHYTFTLTIIVYRQIPENRTLHANCSLISLGDNLYEMSMPIFWKKYFSVSSAEIIAKNAKR